MNLKRIIPFVLLTLIACVKPKEESSSASPDPAVVTATLASTNVYPPILVPHNPLLTKYYDFLNTLDDSNPYSMRIAVDSFPVSLPNQSEFKDTAYYVFEVFYTHVHYRLNEDHNGWSNVYDSLMLEEGEMKISKRLQAYGDSLSNNGFRVEMAEGGTYVAKDYSFVFKEIKSYLSPVMNQYLTQLHKENDEGFENDGGLTIEPENLADRVAWWEKFNDAYPQFIFPGGRVLYDEYVETLMTGTDNTPHYYMTEGINKPTLNSYYVTAYNHLFSHYPESNASQLLRPYYDLLIEYDTARAKRYRQMDWKE